MSAIGPSKIDLIKNIIDWRLAEFELLSVDIARLKDIINNGIVTPIERDQKEKSRPNVRLMV